MTNDPDAARAFVAACRDGAVVKPLRGGRLTVEGEENLFFTSRVDAEDKTPFELLGAEPYLFQALIHKAADIRVTVIGEEAFAVRIHSPGGQWAWIEQMTGLPLRSHLADLLCADTQLLTEAQR